MTLPSHDHQPIQRIQFTAGGYNYLYGVTSISAVEFLAGIFAGSLKVRARA